MFRRRDGRSDRSDARRAVCRADSWPTARSSKTAACFPPVRASPRAVVAVAVLAAPPAAVRDPEVLGGRGPFARGALATAGRVVAAVPTAVRSAVMPPTAQLQILPSLGAHHRGASFRHWRPHPRTSPTTPARAHVAVLPPREVVTIAALSCAKTNTATDRRPRERQAWGVGAAAGRAQRVDDDCLDHRSDRRRL